MSGFIRLTTLVCVIAGIVCASSFADDSPVSTSFSGSTFRASFGGSGADLSFTAGTSSFATPFATGGGWVRSVDLIDHASFGFVAGNSTGSGAAGHLVYDDHGLSVRFRSTTIVDFLPGACTATLVGFGELNGVPGIPFMSTVQDNGEPGAGRDVFLINTGGYSNTGLLEGGDIQIHGQNC